MAGQKSWRLRMIEFLLMNNVELILYNEWLNNNQRQQKGWNNHQ